MSNLSNQLINLRKELGLTQKQLADKVRIDQTMISDYEMGKFIPSQKTISKFAKQGIIIDLNASQVRQVDYFETNVKEEEMTDIAKQIIKIRENLGLNQSAFARKIGVSPTTLCEIESGKRLLTTTTLKKIKDKVGISLNVNTSSINPPMKETKTIGKIKFTFIIANKTFELAYSNHVEEKATRTYSLVLNQDYFDFIKFLSIHYPSQNRNIQVDNVEKVLLLISHNTTNYFYTLQIKGDSFTGVVTFKPTNFEDIFEEPVKEAVKEVIESKPVEYSEEPSLLSLANKRDSYQTEQEILLLCKDLTATRDNLTSKLQQLEQLILSKESEKELEKAVDKAIDEIRKPVVKLIEVVNKIFKKERKSQRYIYVGTKNSEGEVVFKIPHNSETRARKLKQSLKDNWNEYYPEFYSQVTKTYDDGKILVTDYQEFVPSNTITEIQSGSLNFVIGYVEHKAGIVEVIYYDRFVN